MIPEWFDPERPEPEDPRPEIDFRNMVIFNSPDVFSELMNYEILGWYHDPYPEEVE